MSMQFFSSFSQSHQPIRARKSLGSDKLIMLYISSECIYLKNIYICFSGKCKGMWGLYVNTI